MCWSPSARRGGKWVKEHAEGIRRDAILVDLCGVKRAVVRELAPIAEQYGFAYIGGHPMAGRDAAALPPRRTACSGRVHDPYAGQAHGYAAA